jgi:hypothetical protein
VEATFLGNNNTIIALTASLKVSNRSKPKGPVLLASPLMIVGSGYGAA